MGVVQGIHGSSTGDTWEYRGYMGVVQEIHGSSTGDTWK